MGKKQHNVPKTFEEGLHELEQILAEIEAGQVGLEQSLVKYERGMYLLGFCRAILGQAEKQIEELTAGGEATPAAETTETKPAEP